MIKVAIIRQIDADSIQDLIDLAADQGVHIDVLAYTKADISSPIDLTAQNRFEDYDVIHYYSGGNRAVGMTIRNHLLGSKVALINMAVEHFAFGDDKAMQISRLASEMLVPQTLAASRRDTYSSVADILGTTFIMKVTIGSKGGGVFLINSEETFKEAHEALRYSGFSIYQEYIPNDGDYRVHVIGHKAVFAYKRIPAAGDFRANVSRGGSMEKIIDQKLLTELNEMAEKAVSLSSLDVAGIDIVKSTSTGKLYFIEHNKNPGVKGVKDLLGVNNDQLLLDYYIERSNTKSVVV